MKFGMKFLLAAGLQVVCLVGMIGYKHAQYMGGTRVLLEVPVPKDPRSLFSGDYVIIRYAINDLDLTKISHGDDIFAYNATVYVSLRKEGELHVPTAISLKKPREGLFVKGKVETYDEDSLRVNYGIEQFYVPEGTGLNAEKLLREKRRAWVKIGRDGDAMTDALP